jgi:hypothetical protein
VPAEPDREALWREYLLAELRTLRTRLRADLLEVDAIGVALLGRFISPDEVVQWLSALGYSEALGIKRIAHRNAVGDGHAVHKPETEGVVLRSEERPRSEGAHRDQPVGGGKDDGRGPAREAAALRQGERPAQS